MKKWYAKNTLHCRTFMKPYQKFLENFKVNSAQKKEKFSELIAYFSVKFKSNLYIWVKVTFIYGHRFLKCSCPKLFMKSWFVGTTWPGIIRRSLMMNKPKRCVAKSVRINETPLLGFIWTTFQETETSARISFSTWYHCNRWQICNVDSLPK